jgi:hypothetical protein
MSQQPSATDLAFAGAAKAIKAAKANSKTKGNGEAPAAPTKAAKKAAAPVKPIAEFKKDLAKPVKAAKAAAPVKAAKAPKAAAKAAKKVVARADDNQKYKVAKNNTREGTKMRVMMDAAVAMKKFTRAELVAKIEDEMGDENRNGTDRARGFFSWGLSHGLFEAI